MRMSAPVWVLWFALLTAGLSAAPGANSEPEPGPFAEELRMLESAADKPSRRAALEALLARADELGREADPLISILRNKRPEDAYADLVEYLRDTAAARREAFVTPLVMAASEGGDSARGALSALHAYGRAAVPAMIAMLEGESPEARMAAVVVAGERVGGVAGAARLAPILISALEGATPEQAAVLMRALRRTTLLQHETAAAWTSWVEGKTEIELILEIADREAEARRQAVEDRRRLEGQLVEAIVRRMRAEERENMEALLGHLRGSDYLPVRLEAAGLLRALLPALVDELATRGITSVGQVLLDEAAPEELRRVCAATLAAAGRPALTIPLVERALDGNGLTADLRVELVRALNAPQGAGRVAIMLDQEVDGVESRSSALLEALVLQARNVLEFADESEARGKILGALVRLIGRINVSLDSELEAPARRRLTDLASRACETLLHLARLRQVDISESVSALLKLAEKETAATSNALTALRQAMLVPAARGELMARLSEGRDFGLLTDLYVRAMQNQDEATQVNLLALFEEMSKAPEPVAVLRQRLIQRAEQSEASSSARVEARRTVRDGLRALLARLHTSAQEHTELLHALLDARFGENDALAYLALVPPPRKSVLLAAATPLVEQRPFRIARVLLSAEPLLAEEESGPAWSALRADVERAARARIASRVDKAMEEGLDDAGRDELRGMAGPAARRWFVPIVMDALDRRPEQSAGRDAVADVLLGVLRAAHPDRYNAALAGLELEEFSRALARVVTMLREDGYEIP
jgi:hypothetical protein